MGSETGCPRCAHRRACCRAVCNDPIRGKHHPVSVSTAWDPVGFWAAPKWFVYFNKSLRDLIILLDCAWNFTACSVSRSLKSTLQGVTVIIGPRLMQGWSLGRLESPSGVTSGLLVIKGCEADTWVTSCFKGTVVGYL